MYRCCSLYFFLLREIDGSGIGSRKKKTFEDDDTTLDHGSTSFDHDVTNLEHNVTTLRYDGLPFLADP